EVLTMPVTNASKSGQSFPDWRVRRSWPAAVARLICHVLGITVVHLLSFPGQHEWFWLASVSYYWFFYFRILRFAWWTSDTLGLITRTAQGRPSERLHELAPRKPWPRFLLFVPAWGSARCIDLTLQ